MTSISLKEFQNKFNARLVDRARRAIAVIETQLQTVKSDARRAKLTSKLNSWKTALNLIESKRSENEKQ